MAGQQLSFPGIGSAKGGGGGGARALPDLVSRLRVDSTGVEAAIMGLVGSFGKADLALAGVAAGLGILVLGGKSMLDTWRKIDESERGLSQAVAAHNSEIGTQATKSAELAKAQKDLSKAQRELYEYDLEHHAAAPKISQDLKGHASDLKKAEAASRELQSAQNALENFDLSHSGHVLNAAQLHEREAKLQAVSRATRNLSAANSEAATIDNVASGGHKMTPIELAKREDLLNKVRDAQADVNNETDLGTMAGRNQKLSYDQIHASADKLIQSNKKYISDQSDVYDGYAKLIRGGLSATEAQRVMNDAVDLAALKHISLSEATDILNAAEHGRMRGLISLGITTKQLTDADGNLVGGHRAVAAAMEEVDKRVAKGRDTLDSAAQKANELSNDWQELSKKGGPVLETLLDGIIQGAIDIYNWFDKIGKDNGLWAGISGRLTDLAKWIKQYILDPLKSASDWFSNNPVGKYLEQNYQNNTKGLAGGGPAMPGRIYTVGENGPETLVMGQQGGYVIPNDAGGGGGGGVTVHVYVNSTADPYDIANEVGWEIRKLRRTG